MALVPPLLRGPQIERRAERRARGTGFLVDRITDEVLRAHPAPAWITGHADLQDVEFDAHLLGERREALGHRVHELMGRERPLVEVDAETNSHDQMSGIRARFHGSPVYPMPRGPGPVHRDPATVPPVARSIVATARAGRPR